MQEKRGLNFYVSNSDFQRLWHFELYEVFNGVTSIVTKAENGRLTLEEMKETLTDVRPLFSVHGRETVQSLMDQLWRLGLRPTEGHTSGAVVQAKDKHLEDLRKIVFKNLKIGE